MAEQGQKSSLGILVTAKIHPFFFGSFILSLLFPSIGFSLMGIQANPAAALKVRHVCSSKVFGSVTANWCIDFGDRTRNRDLVYNLHGSDQSADNWLESRANQEIAELWKKRKVPPPTVVTVSFGDEWLLTDVALPGRSALLPIFVEQVIPYIEQSLGGKGVRRRFIKGVSMGGFNGAELMLKHGSLFARVALICPVFSLVGPYSEPREIEDFIRQRQPYIDREIVEKLIKDLREEFPTRESWSEHDPLELVSRARLHPRLYISCADDDPYGFFDGSQLFVRRAIAAKSRVRWEPTHGGHCVEDTAAIAAFLAP